MTNQKRQKSLDKKKWLESEKNGCDMSGIMVICDYCNACTVNTCTATQEERVANSLCATAFNRWKRATK